MHKTYDYFGDSYCASNASCVINYGVLRQWKQELIEFLLIVVIFLGNQKINFYLKCNFTNLSHFQVS
jgi:hypothetical protein